MLKKNIMIVVALALPLALIGGVILFSKLGSSFVKTEYDFVYATCDSEWYGDCREYLDLTYTVANQVVAVNENVVLYVDNNYDGIRETSRPRPTMRLFQYDPETDISKELSNQEIKNLLVDTRITSPDGVVVEGGSSGGGMDILFVDIGSSYSYEYFLRKGSHKKLINLTTGNKRYYYYGDNFKFVGWVVN